MIIDTPRVAAQANLYARDGSWYEWFRRPVPEPPCGAKVHPSSPYCQATRRGEGRHPEAPQRGGGRRAGCTTGKWCAEPEETVDAENHRDRATEPRPGQPSHHHVVHPDEPPGLIPPGGSRRISRGPEPAPSGPWRRPPHLPEGHRISRGPRPAPSIRTGGGVTLLPPATAALPVPALPPLERLLRLATLLLTMSACAEAPAPPPDGGGFDAVELPRTALTRGAAVDRDVAVAPDGSRIAFVSDRGGRARAVDGPARRRRRHDADGRGTTS